jgi:hypothetical protein
MAKIGPVVMSVVGDVYTDSARILAILWEGATTSGDTVSINCPQTNALLWAGRTDVTQTYMGGNIGPEGIHAPYGFRLSQISAGRLLVYLRES